MEPIEILIRTSIGIVAGVVGGLAGLGGSIIMLPAMAMIWGGTQRCADVAGAFDDGGDGRWSADGW